MSSLSYDDSMGEALSRLHGVGFEHGRGFVNHTPMAAEALAHLGYTDLVPHWVEQNLELRRHHPAPGPRWVLSAADRQDWAGALGDFDRVADWVGLFERELADHPWEAVLAQWWPRLLPGASAVLTHGVIRTAHAVRALARATAQEDLALRRGELAQGLAYWAARYTGPVPEVSTAAEAVPGPGGPGGAGGGPGGAGGGVGAAMSAIDALVVDGAAYYADLRPPFPVPLIHAITGPAAIRLVCDHLPADQAWPSYRMARDCAAQMRSWFGGTAPHPGPGNPGPDRPGPDRDYVAAAVELGDEHAIKLAEVAVRFRPVATDPHPDPYLGLASDLATRQIRLNPV